MKFYLDNILYDNPFGWQSLTERIYYEDGLSGYLQEVSGSVTFYGGAYTYLLNLRNSALCNKVNVIITDVCADGTDKLIFEGFIFVTDIDFNLIKCEATVEFVDNGFVSKIDNNKSIKCYLGVNRSKNDVDISAFDTPQTDIALRNKTNGADITAAKGYRIFDAFKFIIAFITDGTVDFVSDFFDYSGTGTDVTAFYTVVMSGEEVRTSDAAFNPYLSFEDFYEDLNKIFNLAFSVEKINQRIAIRIEPKTYYRQSGVINYFEHPSDLNQSLPKDKLYSVMKFGSTQSISVFTYLQDIRFIGFQSEEYHLLGECNSGSILDLTYSNLITDTNIIQDILPSGTGNDAFDKNNILIVLDSSNVNLATLKPGSATDYYYNQPINNFSVSLYWFGDVPNSIAVFLDTDADGFLANRVTTDQAIFAPLATPATLIFNNDSVPPGFDANNNYNPANGRYTIPVNGIYQFGVDIFMQFGINPGEEFLSVILERYDSLNVFIEDFTLYNNVPGIGYPVTEINPYNPGDIINITNVSGGFYADVTDYVIIRVIFIGNMLISSEFKSDYIQAGGGIAQTYPDNEIPIIETNINYNISCSKWEEIKTTPYKNFTINYTDGIVNGWIQEIERNINTGEAQIILNSKPTN